MARQQDSDIFSSLPDSILPNIVSSLPFQEAARTSILSKRWLQIWHSTNNIHFNQNFFVKPNHDDETKLAKRNLFINFITNWIQNYPNHEVNKFLLTISNPENCREIVERCVAFATQHNVKELELDFSDPMKKVVVNNNNNNNLFQLPTHVSALEKSLESLKLYSCGFSVPDQLLKFEALKDVSFGHIEISIESIRTLLSTCKKIENLSLIKCFNMSNFNFGDEQVGLKSLVIEKCQNIDEDDDYYFRLVAPKLKFFKYSGLVANFDIDGLRPPVMQEAQIDFSLELNYYECGDAICELLRDLYAVRVLTVCSFLLQTIPSGDEPVRLQNCDMNVRHLILKTQLHPNELCGFMFLLNSCPTLEKITFEIAPQNILSDYEAPYKIDLNRFWQQKRVMPKCLKKTLKVVEIKGYRGSKNEIWACVYLIQAVKVLKEINVNVWKECDHDYIQMLRGSANHYLRAVPKASKNLQINII